MYHTYIKRSIITCIIMIIMSSAGAQSTITNASMPPLFDSNGEPHSALVQLLENTGITLQNRPKDTSQQQYILNRTQSEWLRKPDQERWHLDQAISHNHDAILKHLQTLGVTQYVAPERKHYNVIGVLGASAPRMQERLQHAITLWQQGITADYVLIFAGDRPRSEERETREVLASCCSSSKPMQDNEALPSNEAEIAQFIIDHNDMPQTMPHITITSAAKHADGKRPTTRDTITQWYTHRSCTPENVLYISNQPFVRYQDTIARNALPQHVHVETVGSNDTIHNTPTSVLLDNVARWIYAHVNQQ